MYDQDLTVESIDTTHVGGNTVEVCLFRSSQIQEILVRFVIGHVIAHLVTSSYHHKKISENERVVMELSTKTDLHKNVHSVHN